MSRRVTALLLLPLALSAAGVQWRGWEAALADVVGQRCKG